MGVILEGMKMGKSLDLAYLPLYIEKRREL